MYHSASQLLRIAFVAVAPLLIAAVGMSLAVLIGCAIGYAGYAGSDASDTWQVAGIFRFPERARFRISGALLVVNVAAVVIYVFHIIAMRRALERHKLRFSEFAMKPLRERRELLRASEHHRKR